MKTSSLVLSLALAACGSSTNTDVTAEKGLGAALKCSSVPVADVTNCFAPTITDATFKASIVGK